jgi:hypothetical protein
VAKQGEVVSHWHILLDDFNASALNFYALVEKALAARQIPDLKAKRINWRESGIFSAKREYLRVSRGRLTYDICAAPYGTGYFFSSWMAVQAPIPILSLLIGLFVKPITYFELDTRTMFQESVHRALTDTIGAQRTAQGLRALSPEEIRPTIRDMVG